VRKKMMKTTMKRKQQLIKLISNESTMKMTTVRRNLTAKKMKRKECGFALRLSSTVSAASTSRYIYIGFLWGRLI
jgi:hypothetical protein